MIPFGDHNQSQLSSLFCSLSQGKQRLLPSFVFLFFSKQYFKQNVIKVHDRRTRREHEVKPQEKGKEQEFVHGRGCLWCSFSLSKEQYNEETGEERTVRGQKEGFLRWCLSVKITTEKRRWHHYTLPKNMIGARIESFPCGSMRGHESTDKKSNRFLEEDSCVLILVELHPRFLCCLRSCILLCLEPSLLSSSLKVTTSQLFITQFVQWPGQF